MIRGADRINQIILSVRNFSRYDESDRFNGEMGGDNFYII
ncbi:hypothetical protein NIES4075_34620 [Tolypothrix sp. NIES-4075]|nr:hypothetical protein NIES4075_34620 [Tolypothrix sp. NIES-4075]